MLNSDVEIIKNSSNMWKNEKNSSQDSKDTSNSMNNICDSNNKTTVTNWMN